MYQSRSNQLQPVRSLVRPLPAGGRRQRQFLNSLSQTTLPKISTEPPVSEPLITDTILKAVDDLNNPKHWPAKCLSWARRLVFGDRARLYTNTINGKECLLLLLGEIHYKMKNKSLREQTLLGMFDKVGLETQEEVISFKEVKISVLTNSGLMRIPVALIRFMEKFNKPENSAMFTAQRCAVKGELVNVIAEHIKKKPKDIALNDLKVSFGNKKVTINKLKTSLVKANGDYYEGSDLLKTACELIKGMKSGNIESLNQLFPLERSNYNLTWLYAMSGILGPAALAGGFEVAKFNMLAKVDLDNADPAQINTLIEACYSIQQAQTVLFGATFLPLAAALMGRLMPDVIDSLSDRWGHGLLCNNRSNHFFSRIEQVADGSALRLAGVYGIGHMKEVEEKIIRAGWKRVVQ